MLASLSYNDKMYLYFYLLLAPSIGQMDSNASHDSLSTAVTLGKQLVVLPSAFVVARTNGLDSYHFYK